MVFYIDAQYKCYSNNSGGMRKFESTFFDGKCDEYIRGHRYIPAGEQIVTDRGVIFDGETFSPIADLVALEKAQMQYEHEQLTEMRMALEILGVSV